VGMGPAIERARSDAISSVRFGSLAFVLGPALLFPKPKTILFRPKSNRKPKGTGRGSSCVYSAASGLGWSGLGRSGLEWAGLGWSGLEWAGLGWSGLEGLAASRAADRLLGWAGPRSGVSRVAA
jgi:hypothetical protein